MKDWKKLLKCLIKYFNFFIFLQDNSGKISIDEIKGVFGGDKEKWRKIIREIDMDGDGEIDMMEFKAMMGVLEENELK